MEPFFKSHEDGVRYPVRGMVFTIGSAKDCHLKLPDLPSRAAHLLFGKGVYRIYRLHQEVQIAIDGVAIDSTGRVLRQESLVEIGKYRFQFFEQEVATGSKLISDIASPEKKDRPASMSAHDRFGGGTGLPESASVSSNSTSMLKELIGTAVALLRSRNENLFDALVANISRLLRCDGARLVVDDNEAGGRKTIARYPQSVGLDRFSDRAIDWAREASHTILMHEDDWRSAAAGAHSLERNLVASIMCAPLAHGEEGNGYLYLDRCNNADPFTEEDRLFCDALLPLFSEILANFNEKREQQATIARLQQQQLAPAGGMLFESECMMQLVTLAQRLAKTDSPVLVTGETGTGKELLARYVHDNSSRSSGPYKVINCGAIPENLIESELFGHEKGAFTGAVTKKIGLFESAQGGTVFLDEIGEMPLHLQVRLLRVLQESEIVRVGGTETISVDVRIIAATNRDLEGEAVQGRFRQDLFFRLNVLTLHLPPLRKRGDDVLLLAEFFIRRYCQQFGLVQKKLVLASKKMLIAHSWPGNIRELENAIQKAILFSETDKLSPETFSLVKSGAMTVSHNGDRQITLKDARAEAERHAITATLVRTHGNVSLAGKILEIDRKWLNKKMEELDIDASEFRT